MAQRYFGLDRGQVKKDVTEGSSSTATKDVEVRIDMAGLAADSQGKKEVLMMLEYIKEAIKEQKFPPA